MSNQAPARNVHATAIVVGTTGLMFVGPSGSGKSSLALSCLSQARRIGLFAALVADDQVFIRVAGDHVIAHRPSTIAGLMEIYGTGIGALQSLPYAVMHYAIEVVDPLVGERLPDDDARFFVSEGASLPLLRLVRTASEPLFVLATLIPELARQAARPSL